MTNDKQRVDFPVGENVREDKRGTPRGRLVELFEQLEDPSSTCPRMGTIKGCGGCKYLKEDGCDIKGRYADYLLANGIIVPPCKVGQEVYIVYHKEVIQGNVNRIRPFVSKKETVFKGNVICEVEDIFYNDGRKEEIELYVVFEKPYGTERVAYLTKEEAEQALNNIQNGNSCEGGAE